MKYRMLPLLYILILNPLLGGDYFIDASFPDKITGYVLKSNGGLYKTTDAGLTWSWQSFESDHLIVVEFLDDTTGFVGGYFLNEVGAVAILLKTTDSGLRWDTSFVKYPPTFLETYRVWDIDFTGDSLGLVAWSERGDSDHFCSLHFNISGTSSGGSQWIDFQKFSCTYFYVLHFLNETVGFAAFSDWEGGTTLKRTADGGQGWQTVHTIGCPGSHQGDILDIHFADNQVGYAVGSKGYAARSIIIKTVDGGISWKACSTNVTNEFYSVFALNEDTCFVAGSSGIIIKTVDGGENWSNINSGVTANLFRIHFFDDSTAVAISSNDIMRSIDGGDSWSPVTPLEVDEPRSAAVPDRFHIRQNYPNPFNSSTSIPISMITGTNVELTIHDVTGKRITQRVYVFREPGEYELQLDFITGYRQQLSSGIYIARVAAGSVVTSIKMVYLK